ncbi:MurR/RpiR family transcriptional regulator [Pectobacterium carotovorum]|uniref:MurR/RpiR family transcriptional regulator n=1 Tax=Pectobacterium carotovorum TaxID=554 RepID=UPI0029D6DE2C|nr:MurR/RpiR family transcriptional regulator [Pectobacterium carotovorum]MDX6915232.1 MurR/RpiR family transcriptional regulator [Pectobacterium carotovorum]
MSINKEKVRTYIANVLHGLSDTNQIIANYVLQNPSMVAQLPVKKLAAEIGVSEATIVRFCKHIGYAGLLELKSALNRELFDESDLSLPTTPDILMNDTRHDVAQKIAMTIDKTVKETIDLIDMQMVNQIVSLFLSARRIMFIGFGASGLSAQEARDKMNRLGIDSDSFTDRFSMTLKLANLKSDDLVVAFSHSGETPEVVNAFKLAEKAKALRLAITHSTHSPLTSLADYVLLTCGESERYQGDSIGTRVSQLFMVEFLCMEIAKHNFKELASQSISIKELLIKERIKQHST